MKQRCMLKQGRSFLAFIIKNYIGTKIWIPHNERNLPANFVIFSENMLDFWNTLCYIIQARVRKTARTAMMREIASKDGNFRGVCPVIGRLNCF